MTVTCSPYLDHRAFEALSSRGVGFHRRVLRFKLPSLRHSAQMLRSEALNAFGSSSALPACDCPVGLSPSGKPLI